VDVEEVVGISVDVDEGISDEMDEGDVEAVRSTFGPICKIVIVRVEVLVCVQVVVSVV
jgi:hypothetical protein